MARIRKVFSSDMVCHVFAQREQDEARNQTGNVYFWGDTLFSYGSHFPMAVFFDGAFGDKKKTVVLFNSSSYSAITSGHQSMARRALSQYEQIHVDTNFLSAWRWIGHRQPTADDRKQRRALVRNYFQNAVAAIGVDAQNQKRRYSVSAAQIEKSVNQNLNEMERFCACFGVAILKKDCERIAAIRADMANGDWRAKLDARHEKHAERVRIKYERERARWERWEKERAEKERKQKLLRPMLAKLDADFNEMVFQHWTRGERTPRFVSFYNRPVMLRVYKGNVETTMGAEFPVDHFARAARFVRALLDKNDGPKIHTFSNCRLGHFHVDQFKKDGVKAGCHFVTWPEVNRLLATLDAPTFSALDVERLDGACFREMPTCPRCGARGETDGALCMACTTIESNSARPMF